MRAPRRIPEPSGCCTPLVDDAVIAGIQNRIKEILDRKTLAIRVQELLGANDYTVLRRKVWAQLAERLVDALASGAHKFLSIRTRLSELERRRSSCERTRLERSRTALRNPNDLDPPSTH